MKNAFLAMFLLSTVFGCKSLKKVQETDKSTSRTITERQITTRPGDTITINIPNIRYKDTTIQRVNYENKTVARVIYDDVGNQQFECISAEIKLLTEKIESLVKNDIEKKTKQENDFKPQYLFFSLGFLGVVLLLIIIFIKKPK